MAMPEERPRDSIIHDPEIMGDFFAIFNDLVFFAVHFLDGLGGRFATGKDNSAFGNTLDWI